MKNSLFALAVFSTLSFGAFAQTGPTGNGNGNDLSGDRSRPAGINLGGIFKFVGDRFHTIDFAGMARDIQVDGKAERKYIATFGVSGALFNS
jgi:hypothetical protein